MVLLKALVVAWSISLSTTQFVSPPTDLVEKKGASGVTVRYKQVPTGICELNLNVKSFSGYADVAPDQHMFWWFFEAKKDPQNKPLTLWINGGPGCVERNCIAAHSH